MEAATASGIGGAVWAEATRVLDREKACATFGEAFVTHDWEEELNGDRSMELMGRIHSSRPRAIQQ